MEPFVPVQACNSEHTYMALEILAYQEESPSTWLKLYEHSKMQNKRTNYPNLKKDGDTPLNQFYQDYWEPTFSCKFPTRIGTIGDGGKWVCNPLSILDVAKSHDKKVIVYSLGSNNDVNWFSCN